MCGSKCRLLAFTHLSIHRLCLQSMKQEKTSALYAFRKKQTRLWLTYMLYTNKAMQSHYTVVYPYPAKSKSGRNKLQALSILIIRSDAIVIFYSTPPFFCVVGAVLVLVQPDLKRERLQAVCPPAVSSPHRKIVLHL